MGIISNTIVPGTSLDDHLRQEKLLDFFQSRTYSCQVGYRKPAAIIFRHALSTIGVEPQESLFVGDNLGADVRGARRMGMIAVWKRTNATLRAGRARPDFVISALRELPAVLDQLEAHAGPART
jgi:putative hydrolase of the HAD superfamily